MQYPVNKMRGITTIHTYMHMYIDTYEQGMTGYGNSFTKMESDIPHTCQLPHGGACILQHSEASAQTADVVFRMVRFIHSLIHPS